LSKHDQTDIHRFDPEGVVFGLNLVVVEGPDSGHQLAVKSSVRIGSAEGADLRLADSTVSRVHATVGPDGREMRVRDMNSTNGTFIDGVRVRDAYLHPGSLMRLGATVLRAEAVSEPVHVPLSKRDRLFGLVGGSAAMRQVYAVIERVAATSTTVLIQGETGTGKELVARAIHEGSPRRDQRFLAIDCGAIPDNLVESELFGHVRGAFSGAIADRVGAFEEADGGTLFFDEVGELLPAMQRKLLRALETRVIRRVGSHEEHSIDVRVVAATNRPLAQATNEGAFREELYFRLAVVVVDLPPLRARREDIPMLAQHFLDQLGGKRVTPDLLAALMGRSWPGNVRELRNVLQRRASLEVQASSEGEPAAARAPEGPWIRFDLPFKEAQTEILTQFERAYLQALLERFGGNVTRASDAAGVSRRFLQRRMAELGLRKSDG
jgi:DNA-binding NtrC family response regulator